MAEPAPIAPETPQTPAPSTAREVFDLLVTRGAKPEQAQAAINKKFGFDVSEDEMQLTIQELGELATIKPGIPKLKREVVEEAREAKEAQKREPSLFAAPPPGEGVPQTLIEPLAHGAGVLYGAVGTAAELVGAPRFDPGADWGEGDLRTGTPGLEGVPDRDTLRDEISRVKEELHEVKGARLRRDIYDNWVSSKAQLSESTLGLVAQFASKGPEPVETLGEGVAREFKAGVPVAKQLLAGGVGFAEAMYEDPEIILTHPAEAILTILPVVPPILKRARLGNAKAIKALRELEAKGMIVFADDFGMRPGDFGTAAKGVAAKAARTVAEIPEKIANIRIPGAGKKRGGFVVDEGGGVLTLGRRDVTFGDLAKGAVTGGAVGLMIDEAFLGSIVGASPVILSPAVRALKRYKPEIMGALRKAGAAKGASFFIDMLENLDESALRRWFTDVAAMDNPRAEALLREAILEPDRFALKVLRETDQLIRVTDEGSPAIRESMGMERGPYEQRPSTAATVRGPSGLPIPHEEAQLKQRLREEPRPMVRELTRPQRRAVGKIRGLFERGQARARKDLAEGVKPQVDLTDRYVSQIREVLTGDAPIYLDHPAVYGSVMNYLVELGMEPSMAGAQVHLAIKEFQDGGRVVQLKAVPPKVEGGEWGLTNIRDVISSAVAKSPEAQKAIMRNTVAKAAREEGKNQRARKIADTVNPVLDIFEEQWLKKGGTDAKGNRRSFDLMRTENPKAFADIVLKIYELENGLTPGAPVMFYPLQHEGLNIPNITTQLQGGNIALVAEAMSKKHGMSLKAAKREVKLLREKLFTFKKDADLGGYLDPKVAKAFEVIDAAENFRNNTQSFISRQTARMKKNLTVLNISSGINNITANVLLQSISQGVPMPIILKNLASAGLDYRAYKKGTVTDPALVRMFKSLENTGVLDSDMIAVETHLYKGDSIPSKLAKPFEEFYRQGDALPKLEDSIRTYKKVMSELDMLKDGETASLMVDSNRIIPIRRGADGRLYRKGQDRPLTPDELSDIVGRGASMAAENKFFNYRDTGRLAHVLRASKQGLTVLSPFHTWFSKALAGRRGGLVGNVLLGDFSPIVYTDSAAILGRQMADATAQSGRRAVFSQAGDIEDRAISDTFRDVFSWDPGVGSPMLMGLMKDGTVDVKDLQYIDWSGPFSIGMRNVLGLYSMAKGDTELQQLLRLQKSDSPSDQRRASLALKQLRGERFNLTDGMELIGLAGGPALELYDAFQRDLKDEHGYPLTTDMLVAKFGAALVGGTLAKGIQTAAALGAEKGAVNIVTGGKFGSPVPSGLSLDPTIEETMMNFAIRRMLGLAPTPKRLLPRREFTAKAGKTKVKVTDKEVAKGAVGWYLKKMKDSLRKGTSLTLTREAKALEKKLVKRRRGLPAGTPFSEEDKEIRAEIGYKQTQADRWDKVIDKQVGLHEKRLIAGIRDLQERSKKAQ